MRTKSKPSLIAGTAVGLLCKSSELNVPQLLITALANHRRVSLDGLGGYRISNNESYGVELGLLASVVLGGSAFPRAIRLRKPVPIALSVIAAYGLFTFGDAFRRAL